MRGIDLFDNKFFGVSLGKCFRQTILLYLFRSNMEAQGMDPMQRHILETSYEVCQTKNFPKHFPSPCKALFMAGYNKKAWKFSPLL